MEVNPLISVIIPVYNSGNYLEECLESVRLQTYQNLEILCINDGSVDNSVDILDKYEKNDKRFVIINQNNLGAGEARNTGFSAAKGEYISFVDSDDRVSLSLYKKFTDLPQKPDIYMFNACEYNKKTKNISPRYFFSVQEWKNHKDDRSVHSFDDNINPFHGNMSAVNKIFKKSFLNDLAKTKADRKLFPAGLIFEDQYFSLFSMMKAKSIMINPDPLYYYRSLNADSVTWNLADRVFDIFKIMDMIEGLLKDADCYEAYKYAFFQHKYQQYAHLFFKADFNSRKDFYNEMKKRLSIYKNEKLDPNICERLVLYGVYKNIMRLGADEFYEKYKDKV